MIHNRSFYNLADLWSIQLQRHFAYITLLFNEDRLLQKVTKIRLFQLQQRLGADSNPLINWKYSPLKKWKFNYLASFTTMVYEANSKISMEFSLFFKNKIKGEHHQINSLLNIDDIIKYGQQIFKHNIIFLDQITGADNKTMMIRK